MNIPYICTQTQKETNEIYPYRPITGFIARPIHLV